MQDIKDIKLIRDRERDQRSKGYAYVEFETVESLKAAVALTGNEFVNNRPIKIDVAQPPQSRDRGFGGPDRDRDRQFDEYVM